MDATTPPLTFALLEQKIQAMPEGPVSALSTPRWMRMLNAVGWVGSMLALLPSLLLVWIAPQHWMVTLSQVGLALTVTFVPYFLRTVGLLIYEFSNARRQWILQHDHDVGELRQFSVVADLSTRSAGRPIALREDGAGTSSCQARSVRRRYG